MRSSTLLFFFGFTLTIACGDRGAAPEAVTTSWLRPETGLATSEDPIAPLPAGLVLDARKVALGGRLFRDRALSGDGEMACIDCHHFATGGADPRSFSQGPDRAPTPFNAPSIFNLAFDYRYGWTAKFDSLEAQLDAALDNPNVMRTTIDAAAKRVGAIPAYREGFARIYDDGATAANLRDAIATYEKSLVTPNSRFDRFRSGDASALGPDELAGYRLFKSHGCVSCHQGTNIGANLVQTFGVMRDYFADKTPTEADRGRAAVTQREEDKFVFRVPSLRNVALTAPYFHDGSASSLDIAVAQMAEYQLGETLPPAEIDLVVAFLKTLTGDLPKEEP